MTRPLHLTSNAALLYKTYNIDITKPKDTDEYYTLNDNFNASYIRVKSANVGQQKNVFCRDSIKLTDVYVEQKYGNAEKVDFLNRYSKTINDASSVFCMEDIEVDAFSHCLTRDFKVVEDADVTGKKNLFTPLSFPVVFNNFQNKRIKSSITEIIRAEETTAWSKLYKSNTSLPQSVAFDIKTTDAIEHEKEAMQRQYERYKNVIDNFEKGQFVDDEQSDFVSTAASLAEEISTDYAGIKARINSLSKHMGIKTNKQLIKTPQDLIKFMDNLMRELDSENPLTQLMQQMAIVKYNSKVSSEFRELNVKLTSLITKMTYASLQIEEIRKTYSGLEEPHDQTNFVDLAATTLSFLIGAAMKVQDLSFVHGMMFESKYMFPAFAIMMPLIVTNASGWGKRLGSWTITYGIPLVIGGSLVASYLYSYITPLLPALSWLSDFNEKTFNFKFDFWEKLTFSGIMEGFLTFQIPGVGVGVHTVSEIFINTTIVYVCVKAAINLLVNDTRTKQIKPDLYRTGYVVKSSYISTLYNFIRSDNFKKVAQFGYIAFASHAYSKFTHGTDNVSVIDRLTDKTSIPFYDPGTANYQLFLLETYYILSYVVTNNILRPLFFNLIASNETFLNNLLTRSESGIAFRDLYNASVSNFLMIPLGEQTIVETLAQQTKIGTVFTAEFAGYYMMKLLNGGGGSGGSSNVDTSKQLSKLTFKNGVINTLGTVGSFMTSVSTDALKDLTRLYMEWYIITRGSQVSMNLVGSMYSDVKKIQESGGSLQPVSTLDVAVVLPVYLQTMTNHLNRMAMPWSNVSQLKDFVLLEAVTMLYNSSDDETFSASNLGKFAAVYMMLNVVTKGHYVRQAFEGIKHTVNDWAVFKDASVNSKKPKRAIKRSLISRILKSKLLWGTGLLVAAASTSRYLSIQDAQTQLVTLQNVTTTSDLIPYQNNLVVSEAIRQGSYSSTIEDAVLKSIADYSISYDVIKTELPVNVVNVIEKRDTNAVWKQADWYVATYDDARTYETALLSKQNKATPADKAIELYDSYQPFSFPYTRSLTAVNSNALKEYIKKEKLKGSWDTLPYEARVSALSHQAMAGGYNYKVYRYTGTVTPPVLLELPSITKMKSESAEAGDNFLVAYVSKTAFPIAYNPLNAPQRTDFFNRVFTVVDVKPTNVAEHINFKNTGFGFTLLDVQRWRCQAGNGLPLNTYMLELDTKIKPQMTRAKSIVEYFTRNVSQKTVGDGYLPESLINPDDVLAQETWALHLHMAEIARSTTTHDYNLVVNIMRYLLSSEFTGIKEAFRNIEAGESLAAQQQRLAAKTGSILSQLSRLLPGNLLKYIGGNDDISKLLYPSVYDVQTVEMTDFNDCLFSLAMINDYKVMASLYYDQPTFASINLGFEQMKFHMQSLNTGNVMFMAEKLFRERSYDGREDGPFATAYRHLNSVVRRKKELKEVYELLEKETNNKKLIEPTSELALVIDKALSGKLTNENKKQIETELTLVQAKSPTQLDTVKGHVDLLKVINEPSIINNDEDVKNSLMTYKKDIEKKLYPILVEQKNIQDRLNELRSYANSSVILSENRVASQQIDQGVVDPFYVSEKKKREADEALAKSQQTFRQNIQKNNDVLEGVQSSLTAATEEQNTRNAAINAAIDKQVEISLQAINNTTNIDNFKEKDKQLSKLISDFSDEKVMFEQTYTDLLGNSTSIAQKIESNANNNILQEDLDALLDYKNKQEKARLDFDTFVALNNSSRVAVENEISVVIDEMTKDQTLPNEMTKMQNEIKELDAERKKYVDTAEAEKYKLVALQTELQNKETKTPEDNAQLTLTNTYIASANTSIENAQRNYSDKIAKLRKIINTTQTTIENNNKSIENLKTLLKDRQAARTGDVTATATNNKNRITLEGGAQMNYDMFVNKKKQLDEDHANKKKEEDKKEFQDKVIKENNPTQPTAQTKSSWWPSFMSFGNTQTSADLTTTAPSDSGAYVNMEAESDTTRATENINQGSRLHIDYLALGLLAGVVMFGLYYVVSLVPIGRRKSSKRIGQEEGLEIVEEEEEEEEEKYDYDGLQRLLIQYIISDSDQINEVWGMYERTKDLNYVESQIRTRGYGQEDKEIEIKSQNTEAKFANVKLLRRLTKHQLNLENGHHSWMATRTEVDKLLKLVHRARLENRSVSDRLAVMARDKYPLGDPLLLYFAYINTVWLTEDSNDNSILDSKTTKGLHRLLLSAFRHMSDEDRLANLSTVFVANLEYVKQRFQFFDASKTLEVSVNQYEHREWLVPLVSPIDCYLNERTEFLILNDKACMLSAESRLVQRSELSEIKTMKIGDLGVPVDYHNYNDFLALKFILEEGSKKTSWLLNSGSLMVTQQIVNMNK